MWVLLIALCVIATSAVAEEQGKPRLIVIPDAVAPRDDPRLPNYQAMAVELGLSPRLARILKNYSSNRGERTSEKPQRALVRELLNYGFERLSFLPRRIPGGGRINLDIDTNRINVEVKFPLPH